MQQLVDKRYIETLLRLLENTHYFIYMMYDKKHNKTYWVDGIFFGQMYIVFAFDSSLGWQEKTKQLFALRMPENKNIKKFDASSMQRL